MRLADDIKLLEQRIVFFDFRGFTMDFLKKGSVVVADSVNGMKDNER